MIPEINYPMNIKREGRGIYCEKSWPEHEVNLPVSSTAVAKYV
jgi:hypothetical protein